ncbi:hypothetical protein EXIGLDRAFT_777353 [Exidia glandulosa HHB12029]|uniref:Uncharacterized protein n=1 Tax=Exidia glandulosa HHB12029 TaxID=1314781 RepID=A0A165D318_EXIGL|nr:hypothetical protein EXIGLDRAFT_777353 [Exidia glandulosa HHB12029]
MVDLPAFSQAERAAAAAILWHFEDDDVKKENASLRQGMQKLKAEASPRYLKHSSVFADNGHKLENIRINFAALEVQRKADSCALLVAQQSLQYERRVNTELEEMHRLATDNLRSMRTELRDAQAVQSDTAIRAAHLRMEELLISAGWQREDGEPLDHTVKRTLEHNTGRLEALQKENTELRGHVSLLEMFWSQSVNATQLQETDLSSSAMGAPLDAASSSGSFDAASMDTDSWMLQALSFDPVSTT